MDIVIVPSWKQDKKLAALIRNGKNTYTVHFGADGYEDFTTHKDEKRKQRYIDRHHKREDWADILTPGFWARWILWNKETIQDSVDDVANRINVPVYYLDI